MNWVIATPMETGIAPRERAIALLDNVFGIRPDAASKTIVLEPHLPSGWEDISIQDLPVGENLISFSRTRTGKEVIYDLRAKENGWSFVLTG